MQNIIESLKNEHVIILEALKEIEYLGIDSLEGKTVLLDVKEVLLKHLEREDAELYPDLKKRAETDVGLECILNLFENDMEYVSEMVMDFFEKYSSDQESEEFYVNFGKISLALRQRIEKEERVLYPRYFSNK